jgi:hypothetical protein
MNSERNGAKAILVQIVPLILSLKALIFRTLNNNSENIRKRLPEVEGTVSC